ncbi:MAG: hypothetical protein R3E68_22880 [Burkholderiaceae bacterium]
MALPGVSYGDVMLAGIVPAILYFWGDARCVPRGAPGLRPPSESLDLETARAGCCCSSCRWRCWITMLLYQYSPANAAFWAILLSIAMSTIDPQTRPRVLELLKVRPKARASARRSVFRWRSSA